jgi:predicted Na+-dependent transporter
LLGFACRHALGGERVDRAADYFRLTSATVLLVLNYANSALVLPDMFDWSQLPVLSTTVALAVAVCLTGWGMAVLVVSLLRQPKEMQTALVFSLSMKHTGLALVLAGQVLGDKPHAILMIVVATVVQHIVAGVAQRVLPGHKL